MRKKKIKVEVRNYTVIFEPAKEGGFVVHVPALPGCHTQGETLDEAYVMAQDAIELYIKTLQDENLEIPSESNDIVARVAVRV